MNPDIATHDDPPPVPATPPYRRGRMPSDLLRLTIGTVLAAIGFLLASVLDNISAGIAIEVIDAFDGLPNAAVVAMILTVQLLAWGVPIVVIVLLLVWRRYRRLALVLLGVAVAVTTAWAVQTELTTRFSPPLVQVATPSWVCVEGATVSADDPGAVGDLVGSPGDVLGGVFSDDACVPGDGFPSMVYIAGATAAFSVLTPWLERRWRRTGWLALVAFLVTRLVDGVLAPIDAALIVATSYVIGAGVLLAFGSPDRRPTARAVTDALVRNGFDDVTVTPYRPDTGAERFFEAATPQRGRLFVKVRTNEDRAADILYRIYRMVTLRGFGDERPFASLHREVEHEAAMALNAAAGGVSTPALRRVADIDAGAMLLAFDNVTGAPLDRLAELSDAALDSAWRQIVALRGWRMAHRHLSPANLLLTEDDQVVLVDFGFAELSATDGALAGDVAHLLVTASLVAGARRTVDAAARHLDEAALVAAAARLQPAALSSATRAMTKGHKGLLDEIHTELRRVTGVEEVELEKLERVNAKTVVMAITLGLAFTFLIPQIAQVDLGDLVGASWQWFPLVVGFSVLTYVGATVALIGAMPERLRFAPTLMAQVAASFFNRIAPAKVGGIAANIRYLQRSGIDPPVAVAGVGLNNVAGVVVHIALLAIFVTTAGRSATEAISLPSGEAVVYALVAVMTLAGLVMTLPWGRRLWLRRVWPVLRKSVSGVAKVASNPAKMAMLVGGSLVITLSYAFALWYSIAAFGGGLGFVATTAVYLTGSALAQAAPTPGGIGAAEAALIAGLTAFGLEAAVAVPAVFLYRLATFWLPVAPGYLAYRRLERIGAL